MRFNARSRGRLGRSARKVRLAPRRGYRERSVMASAERLAPSHGWRPASRMRLAPGRLDLPSDRKVRADADRRVDALAVEAAGASSDRAVAPPRRDRRSVRVRARPSTRTADRRRRPEDRRRRSQSGLPRSEVASAQASWYVRGGGRRTSIDRSGRYADPWETPKRTRRACEPLRVPQPTPLPGSVTAPDRARIEPLP